MSLEPGQKAHVWLKGHGLICEIKAFINTVHIKIPQSLWQGKGEFPGCDYCDDRKSMLDSKEGYLILSIQKKVIRRKK